MVYNNTMGQVMSMKPKPNRHDRRGYNQSPGTVWRELDRVQQEQAKQIPPNGAVQGRPVGENETIPNLVKVVAKKAKPKTFTTSDIEYSVVKALVPVLQARDGTVYTFSDWTLAGDGVVIILPNGQEFWMSITEAK